MATKQEVEPRIRKIRKLESELEELEANREIDPGSGPWNCAGCGKPIECMEPYLVFVVNNTEPPEQQVWRFDRRICLWDWSRENPTMDLQREEK